MALLLTEVFTHVSNIAKDLDACKNGKEEKGTTEDEMVGWHRPLDEHVRANPGSS